MIKYIERDLVSELKREYQKNNNLNIPTRYFVKLEKYATNPDYANLLLKTYLEIYGTK